MTTQGDPIKTIVVIHARQCFWAGSGKPGGPILSFPANQAMTAATDELGGNLFGSTTDAEGVAIVVPLGEGEWTATP